MRAMLAYMVSLHERRPATADSTKAGPESAPRPAAGRPQQQQPSRGAVPGRRAADAAGRRSSGAGGTGAGPAPAPSPSPRDGRTDTDGGAGRAASLGAVKRTSPSAPASPPVADEVVAVAVADEVVAVAVAVAGRAASGRSEDGRGSEALEDETTGDEAMGDEPVGDEPVGDGAIGDEATGDEAIGDEAAGDEATGDEAMRDEAIGDEAVGDEAMGDESMEDDAGAASGDASEEPNKLAVDQFSFRRFLRHRWTGSSMEIQVEWDDGDVTWEPEANLHADALDSLLQHWAEQGGRPSNPAAPDMYDIFAIRKHSKDRRRLMVEWVGYGPEEASWLRRTVVEATAPQLVEDYWKTVRRRR